jgi:hypothetical protein
MLVYGVVELASAVAAHRTLTIVGASLVLVGGLAMSVGAIAETRRTHRSAAALCDWTPQRVTMVTADCGSQVEAIRRLRRADPRLSLADAASLYRQCFGGATPETAREV